MIARFRSCGHTTYSTSSKLLDRPLRPEAYRGSQLLEGRLLLRVLAVVPKQHCLLVSGTAVNEASTEVRQVVSRFRVLATARHRKPRYLSRCFTFQGSRNMGPTSDPPARSVGAFRLDTWQARAPLEVLNRPVRNGDANRHTTHARGLPWSRPGPTATCTACSAA